MRVVMVGIGTVLVGWMGWYLGQRLDAQALSMMVGLVFGILAGTPAMLIVLGSQQRMMSSQQVPGPEPIVLAPYIPHPTGDRGEQIAAVFREGHFCCRFVAMSQIDDEYWMYDFEFGLGTQVGEVSRFAREQLPMVFGGAFRVTRAEGVIHIFEKRGAYPNSIKSALSGDCSVEFYGQYMHKFLGLVQIDKRVFPN